VHGKSLLKPALSLRESAFIVATDAASLNVATEKSWSIVLIGAEVGADGSGPAVTSLGCDVRSRGPCQQEVTAAYGFSYSDPRA